MTQPATGVGLRLGAAVVALACGAAAILLVSDLLRKTPGPAPSAATTPTPSAPVPPLSRPSFPAPPPGAVVFSRQDGDNVLALAVRRAGSRTAFQVSVVGQSGEGVSGLAVVLEPRPGKSLEARPCGSGCYRATSSGIPRTVTVLAGEGSVRPLIAVLPRPWPSAATALVERAGRVWRSLRTLASFEQLASGTRNIVNTRWRYVAPSSFAYDMTSGAAGVVIGNRRWDRASLKGAWSSSSQDPLLPQPTPPWTAVRNAYLIGSTAQELRVTFFDPSLPAWFAVALDRKTLRTLDLWMITTAHFMHDVYGSFDQPIRLHPPR